MFDQFTFHITLSEKLADAELRQAQACIAYADPLAGRPMPVDGVSVYVQPGPGEDSWPRAITVSTARGWAGAAYMQERRRHERRAPDLPDGRVRQRQGHLAALRAQLRADEPVIVAHRYITRDSGASDDALRLSEDEPRREALGGFALRWSSHGLRYGIGVEMDAWLAGGAAVIVNGSRAHLPQAHARYPALTAVEIRVDPRCWRAGWPDAAGKAKPPPAAGARPRNFRYPKGAG